MIWLENKDNDLGSTKVGPVAHQQGPPVPSHQHEDGEDDDALEDFILNVTAVELHKRLEYANMPSQKSQETLIRVKLEDYDNCIRLHHSTDVRKYWDDHKLDHPELFKVAQVFMSVPATQVIINQLCEIRKYVQNLVITYTPNILFVFSYTLWNAKLIFKPLSLIFRADRRNIVQNVPKFFFFYYIYSYIW